MVAGFIESHPIIFLIVGIVLVLAGANFLIDGTSVLAKRMHVSELLIGLTVVALATSMPELVVCYYSSYIKLADVAIGNIVGSNIFNTALILGFTAIIAPVIISKRNLGRDLPVNLFAALLLIGMYLFGSREFSRFEGAVLLALYIVYLYILFKSDAFEIDESEIGNKKTKTWVSVLAVIASVVFLIYGARWMVNSAVRIAGMMGVSDAFIAITLVAGGTSLPELATCIVAAIKGKDQLALGNIIGSNISNIFLIIGGSALIRPLTVDKITAIDIVMSLILPLFLLLVPLISKKKVIGRGCGIVLVLMFAGYMTWLILQL